MPIYEFKCIKCNDLFELLLINSQDTVEMRCPKCKSEDIERVMSSTNYAISQGGSQATVSRQERSCASGSCTTYEIPGYSR